METAELVRKDIAKVPIARYMTNNEIPERSRLKVLNEALSITNECYDFRVSLAKERGLLVSETASKQSAWSIPLEGTISFYSVHSDKTIEEQVAASGFVMKGEDVKCMK